MNRSTIALTALLVTVSARADGTSHAKDADEPAPPHGLPFTIHVAAFFGDGLRFDDPYRLSTVLGSSAEGVSRTAAYVDLAAMITFGDPRKWQPGFAFHTTLSLEGVEQTVLTPSFVLMRRFRDVAAYARAGVSLPVTPEITWGFDGALGGVWYVRAGIGIVAELVGDLYYGAGTREVSAPAYPVLSGQLGLTIAYEVIP